MLIRSDVRYIELPAPERIECQVIEVYLNSNYAINIANVYQSPTAEFDRDAVSALFKLRNPVLVGDFNAHKKLWNSTLMNNCGRIKEELCDDII